jgi:predicted AlkP superfamily pyrophosphatase or phosphodiesterase
VILISFDAFRWDYINRGITPNINKIKETGVSALSLRPVFPSKTFPNHLSIITGMYPENHGIIQNEFENQFTGEKYSLSDTSATRNAKWYHGDTFWETAEKNGIKTASYFWPGSEINQTGRHPSYYEHFNAHVNYITRLNGIINWLKLPYKDRPYFITGYFEEIDNKGHSYGPDSKETNQAISSMDSIVGNLFTKLKEINLFDSTDVIILSDHGMAEVSNERIINLYNIIGKEVKSESEGPIVMFNPQPSELNSVYEKLKKKENHFKVYTRKNIPSYLHYSKNPFIFPIIVIADPGWSIGNSRNNEYALRIKGNHGYDNNMTDMQGIFFAQGPDFKKGYSTGTLWNIDIYPLLCVIFNIKTGKNIDGKIERIEFILK